MSKLKTFTAPSVLVIDDVGLLPMERSAASALQPHPDSTGGNTPQAIT